MSLCKERRPTVVNDSSASDTTTEQPSTHKFVGFTHVLQLWTIFVLGVCRQNISSASCLKVQKHMQLCLRSNGTHEGHSGVDWKLDKAIHHQAVALCTSHPTE
eukprot:1713386-Amphidinium_carterae.1